MSISGQADLSTVKIGEPITAFGDLRTAEITPVFQYSFEYTVDNSELTTNTVVNGGTVTQASGMAELSTSTTTASSALLQSKRQAKYRPGQGGLGRFTTLFETGGVASTEQYFGFTDETGSSAAFENGYAIGYDGTTFGFHRFQDDTKISIALADWDDPLNGSGESGITLDATKLNVWFISFQYLGGGAIELWYEGNLSGAPQLVLTVLYSNTAIIPTVFMPNFRFAALVDNKATTTDLITKTASIAYFVEGITLPILTHQPQQSSGTITKTGVTTEIAIFTIRNKTTYASKTNFIEIILEQFSDSVQASAANNLATIRLVKNATLGGTPSYSDINTSDSIAELDTAGTTVTGGVELLSSPLAGKNDKSIDGLLALKIILGAGESVTMSGTSAGSAEIRGSLLWKELF